MNIQTISKAKREVMVELTADDLVIICNALYAQSGEKKTMIISCSFIVT